MKKILSFLLLLSLCLAFPDSVMAKETTYDYETVIDMVAEEYIGKTIPGASIIISEHGDIVFAKGYGYADIEQQIPIEPSSTVFEWGSITKTFVWVSVMQQVELGHIDLSQDIHTYLSDGFLKNIQYETPITMLHLMNHTAGFAEQLFDLRYQENDMEQSLPKKQVQSEMAFKSGISYEGKPIQWKLTDRFGMDIPKDALYVPHYRYNCKSCGSRLICNGCSDCGRCEI